jgi:hypothetical protein
MSRQSTAAPLAQTLKSSTSAIAVPFSKDLLRRSRSMVPPGAAFSKDGSMQDSVTKAPQNVTVSSKRNVTESPMSDAHFFIRASR